MKKVLLSTAILAGMIGGVAANKEVAQSAAGSVAQFVISDSHAQRGTDFGNCVYFTDRNFRGRRFQLSYPGRRAGPNNSIFSIERNFPRFMVNRVSSIRLNGSANTILLNKFRFRNRNRRFEVGGTTGTSKARLGRNIENRGTAAFCGNARTIRLLFGPI